MKEQPLYTQIANHIIFDICNGTLRPNDRIRSESELAKEFSVSSITVKSAYNLLTEKGYIVRFKGKGSFVNSEDNLNIIAKYVNSQNLRKNFINKAIGLIVPSMKTSVDQSLLDAIELEVSKLGYVLLLNITRESQLNESEAINIFISRGVSGLIIFPTENENYNEDILKLNINQFPFVFVDRYLKGIKSNTITTNNYEITKRAVTKMIKEENANIIFISPKCYNSVTIDRKSGFEKALQNSNISISQKNYCLLDINIIGYKEKYEKIKTSLNEIEKITGIFCVNEEMSNIVMNVLDDHYNNHINRLELYCFDNPNNKYFNYVEQDIKTIAKQCVKILINSFSDTTDHINSVVEAHLVSNGGKEII